LILPSSNISIKICQTADVRAGTGLDGDGNGNGNGSEGEFTI
jgi:hypothetical protein